ncbi:MAG: NAD-dependent epimerase/dehydratase family protein [Sphingobacteriaceae bacterium]|nr:NAD-dependent epimerase/dehydratase family protein [Sphingobacteriaceae bacterium]
MKRIVITGGSGFVGTNFIKYLKDEYEVILVNLRYKAYCLPNEGCEAIVHLAGKAHDLKNITNPEDYYQANFELTKELYDAFLRSNIENFFFISSVKAVSDSPVDILTENYLPAPQTHYGKSKLKAEQYIQKQPLPQGKSYYILRPCMIHGPGNKGNLNLLYKLISMAIPYPLASFSNKRSFLSVENLCFIIKEIFEGGDIISGVYNVADDESLSTNEVVALLAQAQNKTPRLINIPKSLIICLAKIGDKLHLPLTTERLQKLTENYVVSNKKIKDALKKELPLSTREGILKTARSFKDA